MNKAKLCLPCSFFVGDKVNNIFEFHLKINVKYVKILTLLMFEVIVYDNI